MHSFPCAQNKKNMESAIISFVSLKLKAQKKLESGNIFNIIRFTPHPIKKTDLQILQVCLIMLLNRFKYKRCAHMPQIPTFFIAAQRHKLRLPRRQVPRRLRIKAKAL